MMLVPLCLAFAVGAGARDPLQTSLRTATVLRIKPAMSAKLVTLSSTYTAY